MFTVCKNLDNGRRRPKLVDTFKKLLSLSNTPFKILYERYGYIIAVAMFMYMSSIMRSTIQHVSRLKLSYYGSK